MQDKNGKLPNPTMMFCKNWVADKTKPTIDFCSDKQFNFECKNLKNSTSCFQCENKACLNPKNQVEASNADNNVIPINQRAKEKFNALSNMTSEQSSRHLVEAAALVNNEPFELSAILESERDFDNLTFWQKELLVALTIKANLTQKEKI